MGDLEGRDTLLREALATLIEVHDCIDEWGCYADLASVRAAADKIRAALDPAKIAADPDDAAVERVARALCLIGGNDPDETKFTDGKPVWTAYAHPARAAIIAFERRHA